MTGDHQRTGRCLCGSVSIRATPEPHVTACHCGMCRRWGGGPLLVLDCGDGAVFEGGEVARYGSSDWAERGFCARCGTHLFYFLVPAGRYIVPAGLFDEQPGLSLESEIYIDRKPAYYAFAGERTRQTEAEFLQSLGMGEES
jgi:hypothetical protein